MAMASAIGKPRLTLLDAYRGFVMLALVTGGGLGLERLRGGSFAWLADQLEHRAWEGCSAWDIVQPAFMFIVGVAMPLAYARRSQGGQAHGAQLRQAVIRSLKLAALGMALDAWQTGHVRITFVSVLQQIAIAHLVAFLILPYGPRVQAAVAVGLLVIHTLAFLAYGHVLGIDPWGRADNVGVFIDRALHLPIEPEGYVSFDAVSSTATVVFGVLAGELLESAWSARRKMAVMASASALAMAASQCLLPAVPMIKHIWTSSFGLYASAWALLLLLLFFVVVEVAKVRAWAFPLVVVGTNSIAIYLFSGLFTSPLRTLLRPLAGGIVAVLLLVGVKWLLCYVLYRRRIFIKV